MVMKKQKRFQIENNLVFCTYDLIRQSIKVKIPYIRNGIKMEQQKKTMTHELNTLTSKYFQYSISILISISFHQPINHEQVSSYMFHSLLFICK